MHSFADKGANAERWRVPKAPVARCIKIPLPELVARQMHPEAKRSGLSLKRWRCATSCIQWASRPKSSKPTAGAESTGRNAARLEGDWRKRARRDNATGRRAIRGPHRDRVMTARAARRRAEWQGRPAAPMLDGNLIAYMTLARVAEKFVQIAAEHRKQLFALRINRRTDNRVFVTYRDEDGAEITRHMRRVRALCFGVRQRAGNPGLCDQTLSA